jgi:DNA ligase-1
VRFARLVEFFEQLEATSSRLTMVALLADLFREADAGEVDKIVYLGQGRLRPSFEPLEFGVGEALVRGALAAAAGLDAAEVRRRYAEAGDYGTVASALLAARPPSTLAVSEVYHALYDIATASGKGAMGQKTRGITTLLERLGPLEAKYLARILLERLRLGIGDPTVMDALSYSRAGSKADRPALERAYNVCSDLGQVAVAYVRGGREAAGDIGVEAGKPVRPALCERVTGPEALIARLGRCAVEPKVDGFRCQVHTFDGEVHAYSRNLEDMSAMFPEIVEAIRVQGRGRSLILEGEAAGYDPATLDFVPFQVTVSRKRKHDIEAVRQSLPLKLLAFDLLYLDGTDLTPLPYVERRRHLVELLGAPIDLSAPGAAGTGPVIQPIEVREAESAAEVEAYLALVVERGQEGIVAKRLDSAYQAGARNFNWIKLKRGYQGELKDTVDCVVVGYWYGRGHRAKLGIGTVLTAVYDPARDVFTTVTRMATGFSEQEWVRLRELLDAVREDHRPARVESLYVPDVWCTPTYVIELQADEITRSPLHTTGRTPGGGGGGAELGYALRFPRAVGFVRADRKPEDATTTAEIVSLYQKQGRRRVEGS